MAILVNYFKNILSKNFIPTLTFLATIASLITYAIIARGISIFELNQNLINSIFLTDLVLFTTLIFALLNSLKKSWLAGRKTFVGHSLQTKIVLIFSLLTVIPSIIVVAFATLFFKAGIQSWFDERVSTALEESVAVAESYLKEHKENIRADTLAMAHDLNKHAYLINSDNITSIITHQALIRQLAEAIMFRGSDRQIIAKANLSFSLSLEVKRLPIESLVQADKGEVLLFDQENRVKALIKLDNFFNIYLLVGKPVDSKIIAHTHLTQGSVNEYQILKSKILNIQSKFLIIFITVTLMLILAAISAGMIFANVIVGPINKLVEAAEKIKIGDFSVRLKINDSVDEITVLAQEFNAMTEQIEYQQNQLIKANQQIDLKRHFNETVISGVSAGIIVINPDNEISMINRSACNILAMDVDSLLGKNVIEVIGELLPLLKLVQEQPNNPAQAQLSLINQKKPIILLVRIVAEQFNNHLNGYIITFDNITELILAQRTAAWSDVARRIAHEIKNPLTPIILAAERLKKKYLSQVDDQENFIKYNDTIIRHVKDIGKIVEEFANFARMPNPIFNKHNLVDLIKNAIFLRKCLNINISYELIFDCEIWIECDEAQLERVMINLFKNAEESIEQAKIKNGLIHIKISNDKELVTIIVQDNGLGFQNRILNQLTEPYITTKAKGTGLGLAIVKKIIDEHNGSIKLISSNNQAVVEINLPISHPK